MFQWGASPNMWTVFFQSRKDGNEVTVFVAEFKWTHKGQNREKKSKKDKQQKSQHCYPIFAHCQRKTKRKLIHFAAKIYQDKNTDTGPQGLISTQSSLPKGLSLEQGFQTILLYTKETKATSNTDSCFTVHLLHLKSNFCKLLHTRLQLFKQKDLSFSYYLIWANEGHLGLHAFVRGVTLKHFPFL